MWDYFTQVPAGDRLGNWYLLAGLIQSGNNLFEMLKLRNLALITGTDDDLPPSYQNTRGMKCSGRLSGNGRDTLRVDPYARVQPQTDMETQIHQLEQEAYCFVLRAFKAQSDAITWVGALTCASLHYMIYMNRLFYLPFTELILLLFEHIVSGKRRSHY
jgi:hypothetical protein